MKQALYLGAAAALAAVVGFSSGANANPMFVTDDITVTFNGPSSPSDPVVPQQPASSSNGAQINTGISNSGLDNNGWDPFGKSSDTGTPAHAWWNIGNSGGFVQFNGIGTSLDIVWGSPNGNNTVTFFTLGGGPETVTTDQLNTYFGGSGLGNNEEPGGYLIDFKVAGGFTGVKFSTGDTAFEFAFTASPDQQINPVPEPSTWAMMFLGFFGIGFVAYRRRNQTAWLAA